MNGITCASMPVLRLKSSAARCCVLPTLIVPMLTVPGCAFAYASSSCIVLNLASAAVTTAMSK
ncbi:hypothetical protein D9M68_863920 [compost metagenome]